MRTISNRNYFSDETRGERILNWFWDPRVPVPKRAAALILPAVAIVGIGGNVLLDEWEQSDKHRLENVNAPAPSTPAQPNQDTGSFTVDSSDGSIRCADPQPIVLAYGETVWGLIEDQTTLGSLGSEGPKPRIMPIAAHVAGEKGFPDPNDVPEGTELEIPQTCEFYGQ